MKVEHDLMEKTQQKKMWDSWGKCVDDLDINLFYLIECIKY